MKNIMLMAVLVSSSFAVTANADDSLPREPNKPAECLLGSFTALQRYECCLRLPSGLQTTCRMAVRVSEEAKEMTPKPVVAPPAVVPTPVVPTTPAVPTAPPVAPPVVAPPTPVVIPTPVAPVAPVVIPTPAPAK